MLNCSTEAAVGNAGTVNRTWEAVEALKSGLPSWPQIRRVFFDGLLSRLARRPSWDTTMVQPPAKEQDTSESRADTVAALTKLIF